MRLDIFLQREFSLRSRTYAENLILRGLVEVDGRVVKKPSFDVPEDCKTARILQDENYASQGAYKLAEALRAFSIDLSGADCADIGCSNGGFTDLMLRRGAKSVLAVDVGECALPESILADNRVTFLKANARELPPTKDKDFLSADLSFISLTLVLPAFFGVRAAMPELIESARLGSIEELFSEEGDFFKNFGTLREPTVEVPKSIEDGPFSQGAKKRECKLLAAEREHGVIDCWRGR